MSRRRWRLGPLSLTWPAVLGLLIFFVAPVLTFVVYSFLTGGLLSFGVSGPFTLENYSNALSSEASRSAAVNSLIIGSIVGVVTLIVALPAAYWIRYYAGKWQFPVLFLVVAAMFASYLVRIYAWRTILGEHGILNSGLEQLGLIDKPLGFLIFNKFAICLALVHIFVPYVILMLFAALRPLEPRYLEAAEDLGASPLQRFRRVTLPLIAAPAAGAFMFTFILAAADFVTPQFLGGPRSTMLGLQIQNYFKVTGDYALGAALSLIMLVAFLLLYGLVQMSLRLWKVDRLEWGT